MRDTLRNRTQGCLALGAMLLLGPAQAATPSWTLSVLGDPALVAPHELSSSAAVLDIEVNPLDPAQRLPRRLSLRAFGVSGLGAHVAGVRIGRATSDPVVGPLLAPGTYTDVPSAFAAGDAPLTFDPILVGLTCTAPITTFTLNAIAYIDAVAPQDAGLAHLDLSFSTSCEVGEGRASFDGHFVYQHPARLPPMLSIVRGSLWEDRDGNGLREDDEPPLAGATVTPLTDNGIGQPRATDADGTYEFYFEPGSYRLRAAPPAALLDPESQAPTLMPSPTHAGNDPARDSDLDALGESPVLAVSGGEIHGPDGGFRSALTVLEGHAWLDADRNGVRADEESALSLTMCLYRGQSTPLADQLIVCQPSDEAGYYRFETYRAQVFARPEGVPPGWQHTQTGAGADLTRDSDLLLIDTPQPRSFTRGARHAILDFGAFPVRGTIAGTAWNDLNLDGLRQDDEPPLAGLVLEAGNTQGVVARQTTDALGHYTFDVAEGEYTVRLLRPEGVEFQEYILAPHDVGADDSRDSDLFGPQLRSAPMALAGGAHFAHVDVGFADAPRMPVTGVVWLDTNGNGLREAAEPELPDRKVQIYRAGQFYIDATTDLEGRYAIDAPVGSRYRVGFAADQHKPALAPTLPRVNGANDSDVGYDGKDFLLTTAAPVTRDLGLYDPTRVSATLAEYFPLETTNRWTFRRQDDGRLMTCRIARRSVVAGEPHARFVCSDGTVLNLSLGARGLRLHSLRMPGAVRALLSVFPATIELDAVPPLLMARARQRPTGVIRGRARGEGRAVVTSTERFDGPFSISYRSRASADARSIVGWWGPQLRLSNVIDTRSRDGVRGTLDVSLELARGIGPVRFFSAATGATTAKLVSYSRDADRDGRSTQRDNCPRAKNVPQADLDQDGVGDACDADLDDDGVRNPRDNCPLRWNSEQADSNLDGRGDACS